MFGDYRRNNSPTAIFTPPRSRDRHKNSSAAIFTTRRKRDGARPMNGAAARDKPMSFDLRTEFRIGTWNVLTLAKTGYTEAICQELSKYRISLAGLRPICSVVVDWILMTTQ